MRERRWRGWSVIACASFLALSRLYAQTDEIQVYTAELASRGTGSLTIHANYTADGRTTAAFAGGVVPEHSVNGAFEWAYGVSDWFEAGAYAPVYTLTRDHKIQIDGVKLRALFAAPNAGARRLFYGLNFELSHNSRHWEEKRSSGEIRPILGTRYHSLDVILNPILDTSFNGFSRLDFAPCLRVAYNRSPTVALALEHYADFGELRHIQPRGQQEHNLFAVADFSRKQFDIETGIGFGLTGASDKLVLKTIVSHGL